MKPTAGLVKKTGGSLSGGWTVSIITILNNDSDGYGLSTVMPTAARMSVQLADIAA
jgi:hypothetical protein